MAHVTGRKDLGSGLDDELRRRIDAGQSCVIYGPAGVGKTHAVKRLAPDALWIELGPGDVVDRFVVTAAKQLPATSATQAAIEALQAEDVMGALDALDEPINGRMLVVDRGERITTGSTAWTDVSAAISTARNEHLADWLKERSSRHPTLILSRGVAQPPPPWKAGWQHLRCPEADLTEVCEQAGLEASVWDRVCDASGRNPAALLLLGLAEQLAKGSLDEVLDGLASAGPDRAVDWIASAWIPRVAGDLLRVAIGIAGRLPGAPDSVLRQAFGVVDAPEAIDVARDFGLFDVRHDELWMMRALEDAVSAYSLDAGTTRKALRAAAMHFLASVPTKSRLTPETARSIFEAHRLFVDNGDEEDARRTALLHVGGLVDLARRTSQNGDFKSAATLYGEIERMLDHRRERRPSAASGAARDDQDHLRSYVVHYKAFNRYKDDRKALQDAPTVPDAGMIQDVLGGYREARSLWPENALWYAHEIDVLFFAGREIDALRVREEAYAGRVREHPQRDALLTGYPAKSAWRAGRAFTALRLVHELDPASRASGSLAPYWKGVLNGWKRGVELTELPGHARTLVSFTRPVQATLREAGGAWLFGMDAIEVSARAGAPDEAVRKAGDALAAEVRRLVQTYADELTREERERKVRLFRYLDLLGGEIGLDFPGDRWLLGRLEGDSARFIPVQRDFEPLPVPEALRRPSDPDKLWFARVETHRDGRPTGAIRELEPTTGAPAGSLT